MLIVCKFKDFYDTAMGIDGIDKTLIYKRETVEIKEFKQDLLLPSYTDEQTKQVIVYIPFVIGFCGKIYFTYKVQYHQPRKGWYYDYRKEIPLKTEYIYGTQNLIKTIKKLNGKYTHSHRYSSKKKEENAVIDIIEKQNEKPYNKIFAKYKVPIFYFEVSEGLFSKYKTTTLILNPKLKDFDFVQIMNPFQANQEISMFIGGVLGQADKPMVEISDKDRLLSKGFDDKWSFRNPNPPKRKQR